MAKKYNTNKNVKWAKINNKEEIEYKKKTIDSARRQLAFQNSSDSDEIIKLIKIVAIVTAIMILFYFITTIVTRKANAIRTVRDMKSSEKAEIQYDSLIIGAMLNKDGTYYVLIKDENDEKLSEYQTLMQVIASNDESPKIYSADLSDGFNSSYLDKESNYDSDLTSFKVKGTTLVKVNDHKIEETFDNYDSIKDKLEEFK